MSSRDDDLARTVGDLVAALQDLQAEVEPRTEGGRPRPPTPRELLRFTSDVGIPAAILVLRTNIEALRLLQRALRLAEGRLAREETQVRERAGDLTRATLSRLDDALADLQAAVESRPSDDEAATLLREARDLRADVEDRLAERSDGDDQGTDVPVDVDAELRSLRDEVDGAGDATGGQRSGGAGDGGEDGGGKNDN